MAIAGLPNPNVWPYASGLGATTEATDIQQESPPAAAPSWTAEADNPALETLVRQMMVATAAEGAAIALRLGEAIICRATAGNAPKVGVELNPTAGLSGRCLQSCEPVLCRDTEADPDVNVEACRALQLRAAILVPVRRTEVAEGVLEVFSSVADIFDAGDVAALQRLADSAVQFLPPITKREEPKATVVEAPVAPEPIASSEPPVAGVPDVKAAIPQTAAAEVAAPLSIGWPNTVLRLVRDPNHKEWKTYVYWSSVATRKLLRLATATVPLSFLTYFLVGPVIRPVAVANTTVFRWISDIVMPGMSMADYFFSFRAVVKGWNLMFLILAGITMALRGLALRPVMFLLGKVEALTKARKQYAYVPYVPHRTEFH